MQFAAGVWHLEVDILGMVQLTPPPYLYKEILDEIQYRQMAAILRRKIFALLFGLAGSFSAFLIFT